MYPGRTINIKKNGIQFFFIKNIYFSAMKLH